MLLRVEESELGALPPVFSLVVAGSWAEEVRALDEAETATFRFMFDLSIA